MPVQEPNRSGGSSCLKVGLIGCGVVTLLIIIVVGFASYKLSKSPMFAQVKTVAECGQNMKQISDALQHYSASNGSYPANLQQLAPDYLPKASLLHCPADKTGTTNISYKYTKPAANAPGTTPVLSCSNHSIKGQNIPLVMSKEGKMHNMGPNSPGSYGNQGNSRTSTPGQPTQLQQKGNGQGN